MNPGRKLDALVAKRIMGWTDNSSDPTQPGMWGIMDYYVDGSPVLVADFPLYSDDILSSWEVVEVLRDLGYCVDISAFPNNRKWLESPYEGCPAPQWELVKTKSSYQCSISYQEPDLKCWISIADECSSESPAHAICLSALKAIDHEFFGTKPK
jgi:hypothetical protein